jgi:antirestriction protein ArdC
MATWLKVLKADNRAVFTAAAHAQRAAEFTNSRAKRPPRKSLGELLETRFHNRSSPRVVSARPPLKR